MRKEQTVEQTPLSIFVRERLAELGMRQSEFCRFNGFDQGLLSKIQSSMVTSLSLESSLRLAAGLLVRPETVLSLTGRGDLHDLVLKAYFSNSAHQSWVKPEDMPAAVFEISRLSLSAHRMGCNLMPILKMLFSMTGTQATSHHLRPATGVRASGEEMIMTGRATGK